MNDISHAAMANAIRALAMDAVEKAKSGHPGLPLGAADVATVLFSQALKYNAADPAWPDRDRFVLSAGHGSMLLYALLHLTGEKSMTLDEIRNFRQYGSKTPGHPEYGHTPGVEMTTGPLGQGLATSVGFALSERMLAAEFGEIVDHRTYVLASDGDLMEGVSQEAIAIAGHLKLNRLIVLWDDNRISIDGPLSVADSRRPAETFRGLRLERHAHRRPRPRRHPCRDRGGADLRQALADRLPDDHRLWRPQARRHGQGPWRAAGRGRNRGNPRGAQLALCALRDSRGHPRRLACGRRARREGASRLERQARRAPFRKARRIRTPSQGRHALGAGRRRGRREEGSRRLGRRGRHPQGVGSGAEGSGPRGSRTHHRLGGPHRLQQHQGRGDPGDLARPLRRPLCPLGHSRARHGRGHQRHGAAWRLHPLGRDLFGFRRLLPPGAAPRGADGRRRDRSLHP